MLQLQPEIYGTDPSTFTFNGSVAILVNVTEATSNITFHKKDMDISEESLSLRELGTSPGVVPAITRTSFDEGRQFYVVHLQGNLDPAKAYEVKMTFSAKMRTDFVGLFLTSYKTATDVTV